MRALAESIRVMEPGAVATLGADRGRIPAATAGTDEPLPELFGMNVWFAPQEDNTLQNEMRIAGCTVRKWSGEAAVQVRYGMIDLVEAAGAVLGLDKETALDAAQRPVHRPEGNDRKRRPGDDHP